MKNILAAVLIAALATPAIADLTIIQKIDQEGESAGETVVTLKVKEGKIRMDTGPKVSAIVDTKSGDILTLMHERKMVMTIPDALEKARQQASQLQASGGESQPAVPKATGRKETIKGFLCEEYETTVNGSKVSIWLTKDLPEAEKLMKQLAVLSPETNFYKGMEDHPDVSGFPMRTVLVGPDGKTVSITVVGLSEDPLPEAEFSVPSGYKVMQMPTMPGQ
jgi:hypothetical protein